MFTRQLGRSGIEVSALGLGGWAIGGPFWTPGGGIPVGWGQVDDAESIRAIEHAIDLGINFFDTSDVYGCGHSESILGKALASKREQVVIATKFGLKFDESTCQMRGSTSSPAYIRRACEASLRRLQTDYIDLYQFHVGKALTTQAPKVRETLESLVEEGKIRFYAWSTDDAQRAAIFAEGEHCTAVQHKFNIFYNNKKVLSLCEDENLASINRSPLAEGLLTGKFTSDSKFSDDDHRKAWDLKGGTAAKKMKQAEALRDVLTSDGRTMAQAAIGWIWARSEKTLPIPGFRTIQQVEENARAVEFGPLGGEQMRQIDMILAL